MNRKPKKPTTNRPRKDTNPTSYWLQLFKDDDLIFQYKYNNESLIRARQRAFGHCEESNRSYFPKADTALVLRGSCDPSNPAPADVWEDYTTEQGMKGFAPVPMLVLKAS